MHQSEMTTWDGKAVSQEEPHGVSVVVYRQNGGAVELLILHRAQAAEPNGDWAWTPPSGARYPGEAPDECSARELSEETGLRLPLRFIPRPVESWYLYAAEATLQHTIVLDAEHDHYAWVSAAEAIWRCQPVQVSQGIQTVVSQLGL